MASTKQPDRRTLKFIDRKQQTRFAVVLALYSLFFPTLVLVLTMAPPFNELLIGGREKTAPLVYFLGFSVQHWWVLLLALACVVYLSVLFSHQIFGPMRRFESVLREKKENPGQPVTCRLRQSDCFSGFSRLLEDVLNDLQVSSEKEHEAS